MPTHRLRPVTANDADLLLRLYASTRADELALTPWPEAQRQAFVRQQCAAQAAHYQAHWPDARHAVIEAERDGAYQPAGRLWWYPRAEVLHVLDITLLPAWRGQGLGADCLHQLMAEAAGTGRAVTIYVEAGNPARRLYDRLGFAPVGQPEGIHQRMAWRPAVAETQEICNEQA